MSGVKIEIDPVEFITIGTIGPKGRRQFHLQAGSQQSVVSLIIEKEQARDLSLAIGDMLDDIAQRYDNLSNDQLDVSKLNMDLRDPIDPQFRIGRLALSYEEHRDMILLEVHEIGSLRLEIEENEDGEQSLSILDEEEVDPGKFGIARFWASRAHMRALSNHGLIVVGQGRVNPQSNGRLMYYWT